MFTQQDLDQLQNKGISTTQIEKQLVYFRDGFPYLSIVAAASVDKGILQVAEDDEPHYQEAWRHFLKGNKKVVKFVPASGAASRMFKDLFAFLDADNKEPVKESEKLFFEHIRQFAFFDQLNTTCEKHYGENISSLCADGRYKDVVKALLDADGLNYGNLPKGLLSFHSYPEGNRTPVGEHLTEGTYYAKDKDDNVRVHFTVSAEHQALFELLVAARKPVYAHKLHVTFEVGFSVQKTATDTLAVDKNNEPFRNEDGSLLFRPGGHGALIENLNDIDADVIFIKNIDNVVPDRLKENEARYKNLLAGVLVDMQSRGYHYLQKLDQGNYTAEDLAEMLSFTENELCISHPRDFDSDEVLAVYLREKLDRPFRVCGMVKNVGEPGGGPFLAVNRDGTISPQILESSQINKEDVQALNAFKNGSHFNPVDLVCGLRNYRGEKYDLTRHVDPDTGFISLKSKNGKELKALELPGLWNGAMSDWNTVFVEVPISTFNPVKTVNDLLRAEHQ